MSAGQQNCGEPEVPAWSNVNITNQFKEALYTCQAGYKLEGSPRRVCEASHWSGHEPQCVPLVGNCNLRFKCFKLI